MGAGWRGPPSCAGRARAAAIPFFAVVAGPIASLNFLDFAAKLGRTALGRRGPGGAWAMGGRVLTFLAGAALLVAVWPGWLQAWPQEPHRGGWTVEPDPGLVRLTDRIKAWHRAGLPPGGRWFTVSPTVLPYLAWYCPGERGGYDLQRLPLYDHAAREIKQVRDSLAFRDGDAGKPDPAVAACSRGRAFLDLLRAKSAAVAFRLAPADAADRAGRVAAARRGRCRDRLRLAGPSALASLAGRTAAPAAPLLAAAGLLGGPFAPFAPSEDREAFGPPAAPAPPPASTPPPDWWAAPWAPVKPHPLEADEAAVMWLRYTALQPIWYDRNEAEWKGTWGEERGWLAEEAGEAFGAAWSPYACFPVEAVRRKRGAIGETPPCPPHAEARRGVPAHPGAGSSTTGRPPRCTWACGPPAAPWPSGPTPRLTRCWGRFISGWSTRRAKGRSRPRSLTRGSSAAACNPGAPAAAAARPGRDRPPPRPGVDPNCVSAERLSILLYQEAGFLDLTVQHGKECVRILRENGVPDAELAREVDQADKELRRRQDTYLLKTANRSVTEQVDVALDMGLRQKVLDVLLTTDWDKFAGKGRSGSACSSGS